jgi:NAD dependent epimerase/dehydratase family enzyme
MGSGRQWWSWISIDDEVGAIGFLLGRDHIAGPVNLTAPSPVTNAEFTRALGRALRRPTALSVPAFGPRLVIGRELADTLLFTSQRVRPAVLSDAGYGFRHRDIDTALAAVLAKDS